jgi:2-oxoglutarate ferredoxin oxidoreductase subunit gamma
MGTLQVRYAGTGGQGIILLGVLTADAAVKAGNYATQGSYYGAQVRGGITSADVVLSKDWVAFPYVEYSDILVALTSESLSYYLKSAKEGSIIIVDEIVLIEQDEGELKSKFRLEKIPFTRLCYEKFNSGFLLNIVAFGYVSRYLRDFFSEKEALEALKENVPQKYFEMEAEAFKIGASI